MFRFRMSAAGGEEMDFGLARFTDGISDWRPIWPVFADTFYAYLRGQFRSVGSEGLGKPWTALSANYAAWKAKHFPGKTILERTGALVASLTSRTAPGAVYQAQAKSLSLGTSIPYGLYHQTGTSRMPQRKEIVFTKSETVELAKLAQMYLVEIATKVGFRQGLTPLEQSKLSAVRAKYSSWPAGGGA